MSSFSFAVSTGNPQFYHSRGNVYKGISPFILRIVACLVYLLSWRSKCDAFDRNTKCCLLPKSPSVRVKNLHIGSGCFGVYQGSFINCPMRQGCRQSPFAAHSKSRVADDTSFDFSSKLGWDHYYQKISPEDSVEEWHVSIPLETIAEYCSPIQKGCDVLMIGCGTSRLVDVILDQHLLQGMNTHATLLDSSATCIDFLRCRYQNHIHNKNLRFVCGDAVLLSSSLANVVNGRVAPYDYIIDKGLMDALLCGDGWEAPVTSLLMEASSLLKASETLGRYILISYRLPIAAKEFLINIGSTIGLKWDFDCEGSNERVGISVAMKLTL